MSKAINLNAKTTVKLNDIGLKIYQDYIDSLYDKIPEENRHKFNLNLLKNNTYTSQLWDIIHIFGKHLFIGKDTPFTDNCIHVELIEEK